MPVWVGGGARFGCVFISVQGCYCCCFFFLRSSSPTAAAASASVAVAVAAVEGCQPLFALIALSIFAAFPALFNLRLQPRRQRSCSCCCCCCFFSTRTWQKYETKTRVLLLLLCMKCGKSQKVEKTRRRGRSESTKCIPQMTFLKSNANAFCATCLCKRLAKKHKTKQKPKCRTATASPSLSATLLTHLTHSYSTTFAFSSPACNAATSAKQRQSCQMHACKMSAAQ